MSGRPVKCKPLPTIEYPRPPQSGRLSPEALQRGQESGREMALMMAAMRKADRLKGKKS